MITTLIFILFFSIVGLVDKLLSAIPQLSLGAQYLNSFLSLVDNLVYLVRSVMPLTVSMIFGFIASYFGIMFVLLFIKMFKSAIPLLGSFRISLGYGSSGVRNNLKRVRGPDIPRYVKKTDGSVYKY